jgi:hypothetical protein
LRGEFARAMENAMDHLRYDESVRKIYDIALQVRYGWT